MPIPIRWLVLSTCLLGIIGCRNESPVAREAPPPATLPTAGETATIEPGAFTGILVRMIPASSGEFNCLKRPPNLPAHLGEFPPYMCQRGDFASGMFDRVGLDNDWQVQSYFRYWLVEREATEGVFKSKVDSLTRLWGKPTECPQRYSPSGMTHRAWRKNGWFGRVAAEGASEGRSGIVVIIHLTPPDATGACGDRPRPDST